MKICAPTMGDKGIEEAICEHFGQAPSFTIVDTQTDTVKVVLNTSEHYGGVGTPPEILSKEGVEVMLCGGLGPKAVKMFEGFGVEVYIGASGTVREAIDAYKSGKLSEATDANACKEHRH